MTTLEIAAREEIVNRFKSLAESNRLAHAYLFIGAKYTGKSETALKIAGMFCDKIDTHVLECEFGEKIKIDEIREVLSLIRLRPFSSEKKVIIIKNVEQLTLESSNALLKTLEEPTASSLLILTTSVSEKLLATIKSRCHRYYFPSPSKEVLAEHLKTHYHENDLKAHFLGAMADGSFGTARNYLSRNLYEAKNEWITRFIYGRETDAFIKECLQEKEATKEFLDILLSWTRDAILIQSGVSQEQLIHLDRADDLERFARQYSFSYLKEVYDSVVQAQKMLTENLNIKLPLLIIKAALDK
ncbi:MAG: ATP-binding protein [Candidatus Omnitrophota bacterium]